jgi:ribosome biogenesis GTPase
MKKEKLKPLYDSALNLVKGKITEVQKGRVKVLCEFGEVYARLKGSMFKNAKDVGNVLVVGDEVMIQYNETGESLVSQLCERRSYFVRTDFSGHAAGYVKTMKQQVLAANFDVVFILASMNQEFSLKRIERYLATALSSMAKVVIVLTKADLVDDADSFVQRVSLEFPKIACVAVSSKTKRGFEILESYVKAGQTIVFLGSSGVGKSSLVNVLANEDIMDVREIRIKDDRGRHTTSHRQLIVLKSGAMLIDTPGIRELGLWDVQDGLSEIFSDVEQYISQCRFSDCAHQNEPGCRINEVLSRGELSIVRWKRYLSLQKENEWGKMKSPLAKK